MDKDRDEGALFVFRTHLPEPAEPLALRLRGLDPAARYTVEGFDAARSGAAWMHVGLDLSLADFDSTLRHIRRV